LHAKILLERDLSITIFLRGSIVFSSWTSLQKQLERYLEKGKRVTVDITETRLVDRRVLTKIDEWKEKFKENGLELSVRTRKKSVDE
jgi:MFS superfamily sulfate permease-like transporter